MHAGGSPTQHWGCSHTTPTSQVGLPPSSLHAHVPSTQQLDPSMHGGASSGKQHTSGPVVLPPLLLLPSLLPLLLLPPLLPLPLLPPLLLLPSVVAVVVAVVPVSSVVVAVLDAEVSAVVAVVDAVVEVEPPEAELELEPEGSVSPVTSSPQPATRHADAKPMEINLRMVHQALPGPRMNAIHEVRSGERPRRGQSFAEDCSRLAGPVGTDVRWHRDLP